MPPRAIPTALHTLSVNGKQYQSTFMPHVLSLFTYQHPGQLYSRGLGRLPQGGSLRLSLRCIFKKIPKPPGPVHVPISLLLLLMTICFVLFVYFSRF